MEFYRFPIVYCGLLAAFACTPDAAELPPSPESGENAAIIRNPIAPAGEGGDLDTVTVARISFEGVEHHFGEVPEGTVIEHEFRFTNTGRAPLLISRAHSTCGCTVAEYPEGPISPGAGGSVRVVFDTDHKYGRQRKPITLVANTYPATTTVYVDGTIIND